LKIQTNNIIRRICEVFQQSRKKLKQIDNPENRDLFIVLYRSWCHNPSATLSLCLLSCLYEQGTQLISRFAELEITVSFLVEIDKLVQLLESPIFSSLRLQLLEPALYPYLYKCLFGLLMLLPQSGAFETLRNRLSCAPNPALLPPQSTLHGKAAPFKLDFDFEPLLEHFVEIQERHTTSRHQMRQTSNGRLQTQVSSSANQ